MKVLERDIMDVNELEIKSVLHGIIQKARSKQKLLRYLDAVKDVEIEDDSDGWLYLTPEQQKKIRICHRSKL